MLYCRLLTRPPELPCHHPPPCHAAHPVSPAARHRPSPARFLGCRMANLRACAACSWPTTTAARSLASRSGPRFATDCSHPRICAATAANMPSAGWPSWNRQRHRTADARAGRSPLRFYGTLTCIRGKNEWLCRIKFRDRADTVLQITRPPMPDGGHVARFWQDVQYGRRVDM